MTGDAPPKPGPLAGIKVLDLSRVLAGPWCSQMLGDFGAEVIKVEQPGQGDDSRKWGPPFIEDGSGDSAYYVSANRNKRAIAVNLAEPEGAALIRRLAAKADIVLENFRVGALAKYGLDYAALSAINPRLIYCSISGFGQTGPLKQKGGYDFLIQGMSGLMSVTGLPDGEPGGGPMKVGTSVVDLSTGLYATIAVLAALNHRNQTGEGQQLDVSLLDSQLALLANHSSSWLNGAVEPKRMGNQHPNVVPYQLFKCADGEVLVALGNDRQFRDFCTLLGRADLAADPRFTTSAGRSQTREPLLVALSAATARWAALDLIAALDQAGLPVGTVNTIPQMLAHEHVAARELVQTLTRADGTEVHFTGFPAKFSASPVSYRHAPPRIGEDTAAVLSSELGLSDEELARLAAAGIIA